MVCPHPAGAPRPRPHKRILHHLGLSVRSSVWLLCVVTLPYSVGTYVVALCLFMMKLRYGRELHLQRTQVTAYRVIACNCSY